MRPRSRATWSRRLGLVGGLLIPGAVVVGLALSILGSAYALAARPPVLQIAWEGIYSDETIYYSGQALEGFGYVAPMAGYLVELQYDTGPQSYLRLDPAAPGPPPLQVSVCPGYSDGFYFPEGGPNLFTECGGGANSSVVEINATDLQPVSHVALGTDSDMRQSAWDPQGQRLFCIGYDGRLSTIDFADGVLVSTVSVPGGNGTDPLWYDSSIGQLVTGDAGNRSLLTVDPATGVPLTTVPLPGNVTAMVGDPRSDRIYVDFSNIGTVAVEGGIAVLNGTTLAVLAVIPHWSETWFPWAFLDPVHGEVDFTNGYNVTVVNESRNEVVASGDLVPTDPGIPAFDPATGTLAVAADGASLVAVGVWNEQRTFTAPIPYSSVPVLGAGTPFYLGVAIFLAGIGILVVRRAWFPPPPFQSLPDLDTSALKKAGTESEEAFAEAARRRWVAWEKERGGRKP